MFKKYGKLVQEYGMIENILEYEFKIVVRKNTGNICFTNSFYETDAYCVSCFTNSLCLQIHVVNRYKLTL